MISDEKVSGCLTMNVSPSSDLEESREGGKTKWMSHAINESNHITNDTTLFDKDPSTQLPCQSQSSQFDDAML